MASAELPLAVVLIAGPQASGKSTLAAALAAELRKGGEMVALVELDQIAAMALPTLAGWDAAHQIFESVTGMWARTSLTCVVAEGSGTQDEVLKLLRRRSDTTKPPEFRGFRSVAGAGLEPATSRL